ncbi:integrin-linked protein kinase 1-like [Zingiber officinale]|uniref:integrin-linked protein kinase 1-like n=1 Tax=Zingiber officinale TaxID=94328 RepID=UPI001C4B1D3F|nr:integrin-linked protein kinase 1-like [Zingiber officinale]
MDAKSTGRSRRQISIIPRAGEIIPDESVLLESYIPSFCLKNRKDLLFLSVFYSNISGIKGIISHYGANVNFRNSTGSTALHMAAAMGSVDVVDCLIDLGAMVDAEDVEGNTPLEVALRFKKDEVIKLLMKHGAKPQVVPIHDDIANMFSECEIDPSELHFGNNVDTSMEMSVQAEWLKLPVTVKNFGVDSTAKADKLRAFRDEVIVLQQIRHPNIALFFGVVAQSHHCPMMIVTEYFPKGNFRDYLRENKSRKPLLAVQFALDISRGMNYLHEHKSEAIIHRNLEPANILMDDAENLKVGNFSASKLLKESESLKERRPYSTLGINCRYMAPELFCNEDYTTKVDVFSFSLVLQEMIEGCPPFPSKQDLEVAQTYAENLRPPFRASTYAYGLRELIEHCWMRNPADRPTFGEIIQRLTDIGDKIVLNSPQKKVGRLLN